MDGRVREEIPHTGQCTGKDSGLGAVVVDRQFSMASVRLNRSGGRGTERQFVDSWQPSVILPIGDTELPLGSPVVHSRDMSAFHDPEGFPTDSGSAQEERDGADTVVLAAAQNNAVLATFDCYAPEYLQETTVKAWRPANVSATF